MAYETPERNLGHHARRQYKPHLFQRSGRWQVELPRFLSGLRYPTQPYMDYTARAKRSFEWCMKQNTAQGVPA